MTADFDVCGVRLVPGHVPIAGRGPELEDGWLAYGTLVSVSRRLRWDGEPRLQAARGRYRQLLQA